MNCKCGCKGEARWLMTGVDFDGSRFVDEPGCDAVAQYCNEAAYELRLPFEMTRLPVTESC